MGTLMEIFQKAKEPQAEERIPAKCSVTKESFDILLGHEKGKLTMLRGERSYSVDMANSFGGGVKAGYKKIDLTKNGLHVGRTYHCPVCGNKDIVRCGKCKRITCYDGKDTFTCAYCGNSGKVSGTMDSIEAYDSSGMKYYPGDKVV